MKNNEHFVYFCDMQYLFIHKLSEKENWFIGNIMHNHVGEFSKFKKYVFDLFNLIKMILIHNWAFTSKFKQMCPQPFERVYTMSGRIGKVVVASHAEGCSVDSRQGLQPVAEVLAYLHVQISPISCNVVGSILQVLGKKTDTAIVGYRWTGVGGHYALYY